MGKIKFSGEGQFIWNPNIEKKEIIEKKFFLKGEEIDFWYFKNYNKNKKNYR